MSEKNGRFERKKKWRRREYYIFSYRWREYRTRSGRRRGCHSDGHVPCRRRGACRARSCDWSTRCHSESRCAPASAGRRPCETWRPVSERSQSRLKSWRPDDGWRQTGTDTVPLSAELFLSATSHTSVNQFGKLYMPPPAIAAITLSLRTFNVNVKNRLYVQNIETLGPKRIRWWCHIIIIIIIITLTSNSQR